CISKVNVCGVLPVHASAAEISDLTQPCSVSPCLRGEIAFDFVQRTASAAAEAHVQKSCAEIHSASLGMPPAGPDARTPALFFGGDFLILPPEALDASGRVHQLLLAGKERMAVGADLKVYVALVGGTCGKGVSACAVHAHFFILGMNSCLHLPLDLS